MKKALWWILGILLSPLLLFIILTVLLYLPPIQNWAVDKVAAIASEKTGMDIGIDHVCLSFPLDLQIDGFHAFQTDSLTQRVDTIARVEQMVVDVELLPLFSSRVVIDELEVTNAQFDTNGFVDAARVNGAFRRLYLASRGIDLDRQHVELNGARLEDGRFDVVLNDSVPEDTTSSETLWKIMADSVTLVRTAVSVHMPGDTMSVAMNFQHLQAQQSDIDLGTQTYRVGSVDWNGGSLQYDQNYEPRVEGLDYNHLDLSDIRIGIDSIYYHDPDLRLYVRQTQLREKSGLEVSNLSGAVEMKNGSLRLPKFHLKTPDSDIDVELDMPFSLMEPIDPGKMRLRLNAQLGKQDLMRFMGDMPQRFQQRWPNQPLSIKGSVNGNMDHMDFTGLDISLPTAFHATATGFVANLNTPEKLRADVRFKARTEDLSFVTTLLPADVQRDYRIPRGITAEGQVRADGARYSGDVVMREGGGTVKAKGVFDANAMKYDAKLSVNNLNLHHFMPHDSLYTFTADATVHGRGTDFFSPRTSLTADATIHHLSYGHYNINNVTAQAALNSGRAQAMVNSQNPLLRGNIKLDALLGKSNVDATVAGDLAEIDLYRLRLADRPLAIGLCGHMDVTSDMKLTHSVSGVISDLTIRDSSTVYRPADIGLLLKTSPDTVYARAQSGDFIVKFDGSGNYERLLNQLTNLSDTLMAQVEHRIIDQPKLRALLPTMKVHIESKRDNPIANLLKSSMSTDFKEMLFDMSTSPTEGVNGNGHVYSLVYDGTRLDTINFRLTQRQEHLSFGGQIRNNKRNPQFVFNALFDGVLQERGATLGLRYYDGDDKLGVRVGAQAEMEADGLRVKLMPKRPTLGYREFAVNDDNYVLFSTNNKIKANINLIADDGTGVEIYSVDTDPTALQDITISLNRFDLAAITSVMPYAPRITGIMDGDYHLVLDANSQLSVVSDMGVSNMTYENSPIGNVSTELVYMQKEGDAHVVEARLLKDEAEIGLLSGTYYNAGEGSLDARLQLERLPLSIVNGFVPDQIAGLEGYGEGELTIKGPLGKPVVDGEIYLDSSYLVSIPYGVRLRFDNDPVRIVGSNLLFENFSIYSYNNNPLVVQGNVNFSDLDRIMVSLRMRAQNYQIIGAKETTNSVAYGNAFVNFFGSMSGPLDNLSMRGKLDVLGTTDMGYILRDSPLSTDNQLDELVKFTDFNDTTQTVVNRPALTGFNMDMTVEVSKGAHIMAYLNADHSNYVDLMGGGTLRMRYTPADNLQLTGKYTLSNGEMKYSLPVIPLKTFTIQDGSYIEFTGDPMNPTLNITATERTKATVTGSSGVGHSVDFNCGVIITKTLNDMGLEFTLDAPEDMTIHNELQSMSTEQRGKLAVSMLTTGMYLADGNTSAFSMNSALSSFLNSEINQITGNALRTLDLSFGMDNTTDATGTTHTDYSFKFAKRFWNNRLKVSVGGKVSSGSDFQKQNDSFFDNVTLEYRLDDTANKYVTMFYQNNSYDWLDGYTQKYGAGFVWRRSLQNFSDLIRFKSGNTQMPMQQPQPQKNDSIAPRDTVRTKE